MWIWNMFDFRNHFFFGGFGFLFFRRDLSLKVCQLGVSKGQWETFLPQPTKRPWIGMSLFCKGVSVSGRKVLGGFHLCVVSRVLVYLNRWFRTKGTWQKMKHFGLGLHGLCPFCWKGFDVYLHWSLLEKSMGFHESLGVCVFFGLGGTWNMSFPICGGRVWCMEKLW